MLVSLEDAWDHYFDAVQILALSHGDLRPRLAKAYSSSAMKAAVLDVTDMPGLEAIALRVSLLDAVLTGGDPGTDRRVEDVIVDLDDLEIEEAAIELVAIYQELNRLIIFAAE